MQEKNDIFPLPVQIIETTAKAAKTNEKPYSKAAKSSRPKRIFRPRLYPDKYSRPTPQKILQPARVPETADQYFSKNFPRVSASFHKSPLFLSLIHICSTTSPAAIKLAISKLKTLIFPMALPLFFFIQVFSSIQK